MMPIRLTLLAAVATSVSAQQCPNAAGWVLKNKMCYFFNQSYRVNQGVAKGICNGLGAELAVVRNSGTDSDIASLIPSGATSNFLGIWINLACNNQQYVWGSGDTLNHNNWAPGNPPSANSCNQGDGVYMNENGKWVVGPSSVLRYFVCITTPTPAPTSAPGSG